MPTQAIEQHKTCTKCGQTKLMSEFRTDRAKATRVHPWCRGCCAANAKDRRQRDPEGFRNRTLLDRYGITAQEYDQMLGSQGNLCAICEQPETRFDPRWKKIRGLSVDHDHETGKVRGLLCSNCNTALGLIQDNPALLRKALAYLEGGD
jgi:Recombination endonuclease VII